MAEDRGAPHMRRPSGRLVAHLPRTKCDHLLKHGWQVFPCVAETVADSLCAQLEDDISASGACAARACLAYQPGAHGSGHWPAVWRARAAADDVFVDLFGEEAVHSFDGFAYTVRSKRKLWLHVDQAFDFGDAFDSLQGLLALRDTPEDGYATALCHCDDVQQLLSDCRRAFPERSCRNARVHFFR